MNLEIMNLEAWKGVDWENKEHLKKVHGALMHFMTDPQRKGAEVRTKLRAAMQEFTTTGDFPQTNLIQILEKFQSLVHFDTGYQEVFDVVDMTGTNQSGYDILDVTEGITFDLKLPGEKIDIYTASGTKVRVFFNYYGAGFGWHINMVHDQEYWQMEDTARAFRNKAFSSKAAAFYALIEAIGAVQNIPWQLPVDAAFPAPNRLYTAERDVSTINLACQTLFQTNKNKGYNLDNPQTTEFLVVSPLELAQRMSNAQGLHLQAMPSSPKQTIYRWRFILTDMFVARNAYYVCIPKEKSKAVDRWDLTFFSQFDITNLVDTQAGWMRYGGAIGDVQQFQRCGTFGGPNNFNAPG